jgi:hypothetical protein
MMKESTTFDIAAGEREQETLDRERLRTMTETECSDMLQAVCRAAVKFYDGRIQSGLPPMIRMPWPASTWEFLRQHSPNAKRR